MFSMNIHRNSKHIDQNAQLQTLKETNLYLFKPNFLTGVSFNSWFKKERLVFFDELSFQ